MVESISIEACNIFIVRRILWLKVRRAHSIEMTNMLIRYSLATSTFFAYLMMYNFITLDVLGKLVPSGGERESGDGERSIRAQM